MGRILIKYEKHDKTFWQKYWGLILFPFFPFWALGHDDGMAGWLDINGRSVRLKYRKKDHPQVIDLPDGRYEIVYRKKSNLSLAIHAWSRQGNEGLASVFDRMGAYDDYKLTGMVLDVGPETVLTLSARGGAFLRECNVINLTGLPEPEEQSGSADAAPVTTEPSGCLKKILAGFAILLALGLIATFLTTRTAKHTDGESHQGSVPITTTTEDRGSATVTTTTTSAISTTTTSATPVGPTKYVVAIGGLRLREQPHLEGKVLTTIPNKTAVVVEEMAGDWAKVTYDGKTGWCSATYLFDSVEAGTATTTQASTENDLSIVSAGIDEANRRIESYRGQVVSGSNTKESLTDDEVLSLFHNAYDHYMQYGWGNVTGRFDAIPGATYQNAPIYGSMDGVWRPGTHPDYPDFDALVSSYFAVLSDDLAAYYLRDKISLIDGRMYYTWYPGKGDEGVKYDLSYAVNTTATGYEVVVTANYYRDYNNPDIITSTETITFPCEKEDGAWVFTAMHWIPT